MDIRSLFRRLTAAVREADLFTRRRTWSYPQGPGSWLPRFDAETERLLRQECSAAALIPLQVVLLLGALAFLAAIPWDALDQSLSLAMLLGRLLAAFGLIGLLVRLHRQAPHSSVVDVDRVASAAVVIATLGLLGALALDGDPVAYGATWPGLLPIYFFTYGQLVVPLSLSLAYGWIAMLALALTGSAIGVDTYALLPSLLVLGIVNLFGLCTRCQLEAHSRKSFRQRRLAERAAADKAMFLRQTSHNLRQPLQALSCYAAVLDDALAQQRIDAAQRSALKIGAAVDELNEAFNRILDIANLESGWQIPHLTEVDINPLLSALQDQFAPKAAQRGIQLKVLLRRQAPFTVRSDPTILRQILGNLVDNAIKYTREGWVMVATVKTGQAWLNFHIRDTGIGISPDEREAIFAEFYRGQRRLEGAQAPGLGIGLAYVMQATRRLPEHALAFYSQPNRGSDFSLRLPYTAATSPCAQAYASAIQAEVAGSYVLVVDDDAEVLQALAEQLTCWGCLVEKAASLVEVHQVLAESLRPPDLLISDFYLAQDVTAHEVWAIVQADSGPVPAIILSAHAIPALDGRPWPDGAWLLRKPVGAVALLAAMVKAMGKLEETGVCEPVASTVRKAS